MMIYKYKKTGWIAALICCVLMSCEKEIEPYVPGYGQEAYVNFFNAVEASMQGSTDSGSELLKDNMVYIGDSVKTDLFPYGYPKFSELRDNDNRQFPNNMVAAGGAAIWAGPGQATGKVVYWMPFTVGNAQKFIFTSAHKSYLSDTTMSLQPKSYNMLHLTESPEADDAYTIVHVPIEPKGVEGKVKIKIVNLSPDLGPVDVVMMDAEGEAIAQTVVQGLRFGKYSDYAELPVEKANIHQQLILKIRKQGENHFVLTTALEASSTSTYVVVIRGFANETKRYIKRTNTENAEVQISPKLRVQIRRVY